MEFRDVIDFWFNEIDQSSWWKKDDAFDQECSDRFNAHHAAAAAGELWHWRVEPMGRLAEIICLDQFSRNMFRDTPQSFAYDALALILSQEAIRAGADAAMSAQERSFLYIPHMHSESKLIHEEAVRLYSQPGMDPNNLDFEMKHKAIIDRFGRYPHRNAILGRTSTPEEEAFLKEDGSSF